MLYRDCESEVLCLKWSNDGTMFAAGLMSGCIRLLTNTGQISTTIPPPERKSSVTEENFLPKKSYEGSDLQAQKSLARLIFKYLPKPPVTSVLWHPEFSNVLIATCKMSRNFWI